MTIRSLDTKCGNCLGRGHVFEGSDCFGDHYSKCNKCKGSGIDELATLRLQLEEAEASAEGWESQHKSLSRFAAKWQRELAEKDTAIENLKAELNGRVCEQVKLEQELERVRAAARLALVHIQELREAWLRGAISEHDGKGGTRSNRNADVATDLRAALGGTDGK